MARHKGGKVGAAGKALASKGTSKSTKSKAGKTLKKHQDKKHYTQLKSKIAEVQSLCTIDLS